VGHLWPFFDLRVSAGDVTLRLPTDDELLELAEVIRDGIHDPDWMPFDDPPWTDEASPERERAWLARQWSSRAVAADEWRLRFGAFDRSGRAIGMQDLLATTFPRLRTVTTYSWLGRRFQRQGFGTAMRTAALHLAFDGLGADRAESSAFEDNLASAGVSRALGYVENGFEWGLRRGRPERLARFVLDRDAWARTDRDGLSMEGVDPCLPLLGLQPTETPAAARQPV
jgi:RimJ/RimL family protein N-acetyltransferase